MFGSGSAPLWQCCIGRSATGRAGTESAEFIAHANPLARTSWFRQVLRLRGARQGLWLAVPETWRGVVLGV
jgi:hypothetical protein